MAAPGIHPPPPAGLGKLRLPVRGTASLGIERLYRVHELSQAPVFFGRSGRNRWDDSLGRFGVLYAGADAFCAFIETFGHATGSAPVEEADLDARSLSELPIRRGLKLVDLTGAGLARLGADNRLATGDIAVSRRWSTALHRHPAGIDGILYRARHDPSRRAVAVFERARSRLAGPAAAAGPLSAASNARLLGKLLDRYGIGLV